jgi:hypothetical protein
LLSFDQKRDRILALAAFTLAWLLSAGTSTFAQGTSKPATEKWRPKEGTYAEPGANFSLRCGEDGDVIVELKDHSISGNEWSGKVTRLTDTAPGAIRLDMVCHDYNLAEFINTKDPNPEERKFKEIMLLRKINGNSVFVRKTLNGKFKDPEWRAAYCPEEAQRMHTEAMARVNAEAEQKAVEEKLRLNPWRPRDGVYATSGTNFEDRCLKASDATIEITERSIFSGTDKCSVTFFRDEPNAIRLFATCSPEPNAQGSIGRTGEGGSIPASTSSETIILKKIDDTPSFCRRARTETLSTLANNCLIAAKTSSGCTLSKKPGSKQAESSTDRRLRNWWKRRLRSQAP